MPRSTINFSSFCSPRLGLYFIFFFATKLLVSYLSLTQQNTGVHLSLLHSSFLECLVHINQHPKYQPERWLKQKRLYELNQEFNKIGIFWPCSLGKQLSHLACLGSLLACPSKWFTCIYKTTCISPCPLGKQANKVYCPARTSTYSRWLNRSFFQALCVDSVICTADGWAIKMVRLTISQKGITRRKGTLVTIYRVDIYH